MLSSIVRGDTRWLDAAALLGGLAWLTSLAFEVPSLISIPLVDRLVALGPLVVAPLAVEAGLRSGGPHGPRRLARLVTRALPFASAAALLAVFSGTGPVAAGLASVWLVESVLIAALGLTRLLARGPGPVHEAAIDAGHLYLPIGAAWFLASRLELELMGFGHVIVLLTAAHFHFAGLAAPVVVGQVGRLVDPASRVAPIYRLAAALVLATPILVAIGIAWSPLVEVITAGLLACGMLAVALVTVVHVAPRRGAAGWLLGGAQLVLLLTMGLALVYAVGELLGRPLVAIHPMVQWHGQLNALGYAVPSLIALRWLSPRAHGRAVEHAPFVRVAGRGLRIGPHHLDARVEGPARGLLPNLAAMLRVEHPDAAPHPHVAAFYEDTLSVCLVCQPRWRPLFAGPARAFVLFARAMGQLVLPIAPRPHLVVSRLGRLLTPPLPGAVASIRTYEDGSAMYVAVYAEHQAEGVRYMNIGMPLPLGCSLASILRGAPLEGGGLTLTTLPGEPRGHEGIWLVLPLGLRVRLPLHETLYAHAAETAGGRAQREALPFAGGGAQMVATHHFRVLGLPCLDLAYVLGPRDALEVLRAR